MPNNHNLMTSAMMCSSEPGVSSTGGGSDGEDSCQNTSLLGKPAHLRKTRFCQALGCTVELSKTGRAYCIKRGLCPEHMKADAILRQGGGDDLWRFCQQCGKLEPLSRFEGAKRSCRNGLRKRRVSSQNSEKANFTLSHNTISSSSGGCKSPQQQQQQQQCKAPAAARAVPENVIVLENQLQSLQTLLSQLERETAAAAVELNTELMYAAGGSSSSDVATCALMNAANNGINPLAAFVDAQCNGNWQQQQQQQNLNCFADVKAATPSVSAATAAAATPTTLEEWMQLAESDDAHFTAWIEHVLHRDAAAAATAAAAPAQQMDMLLETELWRSVYRG